MTLRIQKSDEREQVVFRLSGRIQADQIQELRTLLRAEAPNHTVVLDLHGVRLVDRDAVCFLAWIEAQGARLRNCPAFIRAWISQERHGMYRNTDSEAPQL